MEILSRFTGGHQNMMSIQGIIHLVCIDGIYRYQPDGGIFRWATLDDVVTTTDWECCDGNLFVSSNRTDDGCIAFDMQTETEQFRCGRRVKTLASDAGVVFLGCSPLETSRAIDARSGATRWSCDDTGTDTRDITVGPENIFLLGNDYDADRSWVRAVSRTRGDIAWSWSSTKNLSSIDLVDGTLLLDISKWTSSECGELVALDASSGAVEWQTAEMTDFGFCGDQLIVGDETMVHRIDLDSGTSSWSEPADCWAVGDKLYVARDTVLYTFHPNGPVQYDSVGDTEVYFPDEPQNNDGMEEAGEEDIATADVSFCRMCGHDLTVYAEIRFCPNCGTNVVET